MLMVTILICVAMTGCKGHTKESLNSEGEVLFQQGNYNGAIVHYKNALEKDPNFVDARFNLGLAYLETGKLDQAEREFQKVQLQNPRDSRVTFQLARIANFQNKPAVAVPLLTSYLQEHPDDPAAMEQLAFSATISGDLAGAQELLEKVIAVEPGRVSARLALIHIYMTQGDGARAREAVDALLKEDSNNRPALHVLAQLEARERDPDGMLDVYSRISSTYPSDLFARYKEGSLLIDKGQGEAVKASAEAMIKEFPDKAEGHRLLGLYLSREGRFDEAVTSLTKSLRIQPDLETYYLLGLAYYYVGNLEMAVTQFQTVLDYSPGFVQARIMQGEIFLRQRRGAEALVVAEKMLESNQEDFRAHALKGDALLLLGKPQESQTVYEKASALAPTHYGLLLKNGLLKLSLGDATGEQELKKALEVSPQGLDARLALHAFYLRNGRSDEAMSVLTEGLGAGKTDAVLYNALAKASLGRKDAEGAEDYLAKARVADPAYLQTYYNVATFMLAKGKPDEAIAQYDLALGVKPDDVRALTASAAVLDKQGKPDEARARLDKARATGDLGSALMLSGFLQQHGKSDEALTVLDEELLKQPDNMGIVLAKAKLHLVRKEPDKAMALYGRLEASDPWAGTMERTRAWMALGDVDKAEESARRLIQLSPSKAQSYLPLASILEVRKDRAGAEAELLKGVALEPKNPRMGVLLAEFHLRGREVDKALAAFEAVLAYAPTDAQALTGKGMCVQLMGRKDEAAKLYLQAVQAQNDHVPALNNLAMLWADGEETRLQALNLATAAFTRANSDPSVIDTLAYTLIRNDRSEEALKVLERALSLAPGHPAILYHKGLALAELGRVDEALPVLEQALAGGDFEDKAEAQKLFETLKKE
ncbi:MAG: PEP-CTERM system TPR-repeat protein PrsT [Desulfomicrobium sp.]|nr:PEP-CTERM system TPR-repeat protein PrsT [Desulfomicrobium sp.]